MSASPRAPHPAETQHEVRGRVRTCLPARRDRDETGGGDTERDSDWNLVRGED
ncbi:hypothetical protein ACIRF8_19495 [Streptomyces sp. NPDC102406]|uniref:hypothetical protein n=1 Tax=Streptomyces sp. NPDC102406 TaxID=3366171 RepID=UPI0037F9E7A6